MTRTGGTRAVDAALAALRRTGATSLVGRSRWRQQRLLILCYHGVSKEDEHEWDDQLFVTASFLRRRLELLRSHRASVLPLGEAVSLLAAGRLPPRSVVLTFDDGMHNFVSEASDVLKSFDCPATNYVSTHYCATQRPVLGLAIRYLLWRGRTARLPAGFVDSRASVDLSDPAARTAVADRIHDRAMLLRGDRARQRDLLRDLGEAVGCDWDELMASRKFACMNLSELREMAERGFDLQLHTHRHRVPDERDRFIEEIELNRSTLRTATGKAAEHFCYPSGVTSPAFLPWLRSLGVATATTGEVRLATVGDDVLLLPRFVDTMRQSEERFCAWLQGTAELVGSLRR